MSSHSDNPFEVAKADNLSPEEIIDLWAEPPTPWTEILPSAPPTARVLLGGKGCGRTHIMRYRAIRSMEEAGTVDPPSLAFWIPLSGLNASKFRGKGWEASIWSRVFGYDLELQVAQHVLDQVGKIGVHLDERSLTSKVCAALTLPVGQRCPTTVVGLSKLMFRLQRDVELPINELPMNPQATVRIHANPGGLLLALADALRAANPNWRNVRTLYLFDELELIPEEHQQYLQSLVRESTTSATVILGSRLSGLRTLRTLTGEENREGSEFRKIALDNMNVDRRKTYRRFAKLLLVRRLANSHVPADLVDASENKQFAWLNSCLQSLPRLRLLSPQSHFPFLHPESSLRPYFSKLRSHLARSRIPTLADAIIDHLAAPEYPLLEKANLLIFYRVWATQSDLDLKEEAAKIHTEAARVISGDLSHAPRHREVLDKYLTDLAAQIYRECNKSVPYAGLATFVEMSEGNPRNLINLFFHTFNAARFHGEQPFHSAAISIEGQRRGANAASDWFMTDAIGPGDEAKAVTRFLDRLGNLMREVRFSDKPYESSCSAFSVDSDACAADTRRILNLATGWSLLLRRSHKDKNSKRIIEKYQISGMLSPRWDLPIHRRGTFALLPRDVDMLCSANGEQAYAEILKSHLAGLTAPFDDKAARRRRTPNKRGRVEQNELF